MAFAGITMTVFLIFDSYIPIALVVGGNLFILTAAACILLSALLSYLIGVVMSALYAWYFSREISSLELSKPEELPESIVRAVPVSEPNEFKIGQIDRSEELTKYRSKFDSSIEFDEKSCAISLVADENKKPCRAWLVIEGVESEKKYMKMISFPKAGEAVLSSLEASITIKKWWDEIGVSIGGYSCTFRFTRSPKAILETVSTEVPIGATEAFDSLTVARQFLLEKFKISAPDMTTTENSMGSCIC